MNQDHIFLDLALSDGEKKEILAIAIVRTDRKGKVLAAFSDQTSVDGEHDERQFRSAMTAVEDIILAKGFEPSYVVVAHFAEVDRRALAQTFERYKLGVPFPRRAWLDTAQLAWPLAYNDMISERSLESLCAHFEIERKPDTADTAMGDCEALVRIYWAMMGRYKLALQGEEVVRNVGGETLAKARRALGHLF